MKFIGALILIACGVLGASSFIIERKPEAKRYIDKLVPYEAVLGVVLLVGAVLVGLRNAGQLAFGLHRGLFTWIAWWVYVVDMLLLGFFLGMPLIARWIPGEHPAEVKALDMHKKLAPYRTAIGLVGIGIGIYMLLYVL